MSTLKQQRLTSLLNKSNAANICGHEEELNELMEEYFLSDNSDSDAMADLSDDEEGCDVLTESEVSDCEKEDGSLVVVSVDTASNPVDMSADDEVTHATVEDVSNYAYRCTQIKRVAT